MLDETLRAEAQVLHDMLSTHDTDDFMRRLALRIAEDASRPPRVRTPDSAEPAPPLAAPVPGYAPPSYGTPPHPSTRPRPRNRPRRRPTPIVASDAAAHPSAVLAHVRSVCETVLCSNDIDTLLAFDTYYDQAGARTFACLLYTIDRHESALYWWGFAAGAGDPIAAHLLAAHHAAVGTPPDARVWRAFARMLGYRADDLPQPVRWSNHLGRDFALRIPMEAELRQFLTYDRLPHALVRH
ncbi:hypothetical protein [Streptomyces sp. NPDC006510]|uniref:hypothetical protein n=1 Tax=Streptomyces sp. NPDC006510 TaxID=3155600 RepID=UPI0033A15C86